MLKNKALTSFFWLFLVSLPFGLRHLIFQFTPEFNEYGAVFLYASDILMVLFLVFFGLNQAKPTVKNGFVAWRIEKKILILFLLLAFVSMFFAFYKLLSLYNFIRLVLLVLTALAVGEMIKRRLISLERIFAVIAGLAIFESIIAFLQFWGQKSLGLKFLGESVLGPQISGVAKIIVEGSKLIRAYGTFPHPNILAAFLLLGLFCSCYFLFKNRHEITQMTISRGANWPLRELWSNFGFFCLYSLAVFIIGLGLVLTFSRTAWFLGLFLTVVYVFYIFTLKGQLRFKANTLAIVLFIFLTVFSAMNWLIVPRAKIDLSEPSVSLRVSYDKMGLYLLENNPLGVGLGNQVLYSMKNGTYQIFGMSQEWQWQPIHNIYLLIASEVGVLGLIVFICFFLKILAAQVKFLLKNKDFHNGSLNLVVLLMFLSLLGFGFFDHFLWTLQPGRLMLWLVLGIMLGVEDKESLPS